MKIFIDDVFYEGNADDDNFSCIRNVPQWSYKLGRGFIRASDNTAELKLPVDQTSPLWEKLQSMRKYEKGHTIRIEDDFGNTIVTCCNSFITAIRTFSYTHLVYFTILVGDADGEIKL